MQLESELSQLRRRAEEVEQAMIDMEQEAAYARKLTDARAVCETRECAKPQNFRSDYCAAIGARAAPQQMP